jgi:hypothetical protein
MSEETNQKEGREYTAAELQAMRTETLKFYADQAKMLKAECEVQELRARINKAKFESMESTFKMMQLNMAFKEVDEEDENSPKAEPELKPE